MTTPNPTLDSAPDPAAEREAVRHFHGGVRAIRLAKVDDFAGHVMAILRAMVEASRDE